MTMDPERLFLLSGGERYHRAVDEWFAERPGDLAALGRRWFETLRAAGDDVVDLLHDDHPTACIGEAAFGYVNVFKAHVNVGFFRGAELPDPDGILEGTGRFMRHVKRRLAMSEGDAALERLINAAYEDMQRRLAAGHR